MGGRYYPNRKSTVEASCDLNIFRLKKWGMLREYASTELSWKSTRTGKVTRIGIEVEIREEAHARVYYTVIDREGNKEPFDYEIPLVTTPCNFGGVRYWFLCPYCYRRAGCLYMIWTERRFLCQRCGNLAYDSQNECSTAAFGVACRKAEKLRSELKRWTYKGLPTRKVRRLRRVERKVGIFGSMAMQSINKLKARISRR